VHWTEWACVALWAREGQMSALGTLRAIGLHGANAKQGLGLLQQQSTHRIGFCELRTILVGTGFWSCEPARERMPLCLSVSGNCAALRCLPDLAWHCLPCGGHPMLWPALMRMTLCVLCVCILCPCISGGWSELMCQFCYSSSTCYAAASWLGV
jgi:hypothetical protein